MNTEEVLGGIAVAAIMVTVLGLLWLGAVSPSTGRSSAAMLMTNFEIAPGNYGPTPEQVAPGCVVIG